MEMLQNDFVSNVSHEFKTPLNAIEGYVTLLEDRSLTPEEQELMQRIYLNGERPADLCREMGLKRSALSMRLRRIREKLKKYLD